MPKFWVYEEKCYTIEANSEELALDKFLSLTSNEREETEVKEYSQHVVSFAAGYWG